MNSEGGRTIGGKIVRVVELMVGRVVGCPDDSVGGYEGMFEGDYERLTEYGSCLEIYYCALIIVCRKWKGEGKGRTFGLKLKKAAESVLRIPFSQSSLPSDQPCPIANCTVLR